LAPLSVDVIVTCGNKAPHVINDIGLAIPPSLLLQADAVIQQEPPTFSPRSAPSKP
jgi:hypothetical protein